MDGLKGRKVGGDRKGHVRGEGANEREKGKGEGEVGDLHSTMRSTLALSSAFWMTRIWIAESVPSICPSCPGCAPKVPTTVSPHPGIT